ncbi:MAG: hypothetical protein KGM42_16290 [Hyphomicrobiales bacterium]|nr:hypothetical protein [Hyphomicrobiales bacterium]
MSESDQVEQFRANFRTLIFERLVLTHALLIPVKVGRLSIADSLRDLERALDDMSATVLRAVGNMYSDPALTALYADEASDVTEGVKADARRLADLAEKQWK